MSKEWKLVGTSALDQWLPETEVIDPKEKARIRWNRRKKAFKWKMKIDRMATTKPPKKNIQKELLNTEE